MAGPDADNFFELNKFTDPDGNELTLGEVITEDQKQLAEAMRDFEGVFADYPGTIDNARRVVEEQSGNMAAFRVGQALGVDQEQR